MTTENTHSEPASAASTTSITTKVAEQIAGAAPSIIAKVVDRLASLEIEKRANAVFDALSASRKIRQELHKIKPDLQSYDGLGGLVSEHYSKAKSEEKKKLEDQFLRIDSAIGKAINNDFSQLLSLNLKTETNS